MRLTPRLSGALGAILAVATVAACTTTRPPIAEQPTRIVRPVRIGTLASEDTLPLWVAEKEGAFAEVGLTDVSIVTFASARERDAAFASGTVDAMAADLVAAARLEQSGTSVTVATVMLGSGPGEGRVGIVSSPASGIATAASLSGVPVGTSLGTLEEYVLDGVLRHPRVPAAKVRKVEVADAEERFDRLMAGELKAAVLPEPLLSLAIAGGATLVADDTTGENLSQTVLVFSDAYLRSEGGIETEAKVLDAWDMGVDAVDADPDSWREVLAEKGALPEKVKASYAVETYPKADPPSAEAVDAVLAWMKGKGLLGAGAPTYESLVIVMP